MAFVYKEGRVWHLHTFIIHGDSEDDGDGLVLRVLGYLWWVDGFQAGKWSLRKHSTPDLFWGKPTDVWTEIIMANVNIQVNWSFLLRSGRDSQPGGDQQPRDVPTWVRPQGGQVGDQDHAGQVLQVGVPWQHHQQKHFQTYEIRNSPFWGRRRRKIIISLSQPASRWRSTSRRVSTSQRGSARPHLVGGRRRRLQGGQRQVRRHQEVRTPLCQRWHCGGAQQVCEASASDLFALLITYDASSGTTSTWSTAQSWCWSVNKASLATRAQDPRGSSATKPPMPLFRWRFSLSTTLMT